MNESHKLYDETIRLLPNDGSIAFPDQINIIDLRYLSSLGYIEYLETEEGNITHMALTDLGMVFISEGGFAEKNRIREEHELDRRLQRENWEAIDECCISTISISLPPFTSKPSNCLANSTSPNSVFFRAK